MNGPQTLAQIRELLTSHGLGPRHALGQNFLIDRNLVTKLVDASGVGPGDLVLEIGPGTGTLTGELLSRGCEVVACELDEGLATLMESSFKAESRLKLIRGDCLASKRRLNQSIVDELGDRRFTLVANLPYGAATPLIMTLLTDHPTCASMHVTIQRELLDRLVAKPGSRDFGPLSALSQAAAETTAVATLPPECFWPRPDVHSAMASIVRRDTPLIADLAGFGAFLQTIFASRRKQIGSMLGRTFRFPPGIAPTDRAEGLDVSALISLYGARETL